MCLLACIIPTRRALAVEPQHLVAVVGSGREQVGPHIQELAPDAVLAVQETQDGTGHAVRVGLAALKDRCGTTQGTVVVMAGDTPLMQGATLAGLVEDHAASRRAITVLTGEVADPFGYGRVIRGADGSVTAIVEQKDADEQQAAVREINSGVFAFDGEFLAGALTRITNDNAKGEYYLTDVVGIAHAEGLSVGAHRIDDVMQTEGANDRAQLAALGRELNRRILDRWMRDGVTVMDPETTWVDADVVLEPDVTVLPGVQLLGATVVAEDAVVGPDCTLKDTEVGRGAKVVRTHAELAVIGEGASFVDSPALDSAAPGIAHQQERTALSGAIDVGAGTDEETVFFHVRREAGHANDTYGSDARFIGLMVFGTFDKANDG